MPNAPWPLDRHTHMHVSLSISVYLGPSYVNSPSRHSMVFHQGLRYLLRYPDLDLDDLTTMYIYKALYLGG